MTDAIAKLKTINATVGGLLKRMPEPGPEGDRLTLDRDRDFLLLIATKAAKTIENPNYPGLALRQIAKVLAWGGIVGFPGPWALKGASPDETALLDATRENALNLAPSAHADLSTGMQEHHARRVAASEN